MKENGVHPCFGLGMVQYEVKSAHSVHADQGGVFTHGLSGPCQSPLNMLLGPITDILYNHRLQIRDLNKTTSQPCLCVSSLANKRGFEKENSLNPLSED